MEVPNYMPRLLCQLNEQRKRDFFCDCSIIVEGQVFKAHRNILFAGSGYFRALLVHYLQDSGQRHSTASLDIVTASAFSLILDFLYCGRLDLRRDNVIEVMSAASYLQMTDVVNFCKNYIHTSLEICNRGRELEEGGVGRGGEGGRVGVRVGEGEGEGEGGSEVEGPADSRTSAAAERPGISGSPSPDASQDGRPPAPQSSSARPSSSSSNHNPTSSAAAVMSLSAALSSRMSEESEGSGSRGEFSVTAGAGAGPGPAHHLSDPRLKADPGSYPSSSSSGGGLMFGLVQLKEEYDPDEDADAGESPELKDPLGFYNRSALFDGRGLEASLSGGASAAAAAAANALGPDYDGYQGKLMHYYSQSLGGAAVPLLRGEEGMGHQGNVISMEMSADWFGDDTGDGLVVSVKLHKCPYCPYTAKQKGILKRHIRCHTGERPYPCHLCGKRFTRQEHLRSHAHSVHRASWPVVCRGCRRVFSEGASPSLKRGGLCEGCTGLPTTTSQQEPASSHPGSQSEGSDRSNNAEPDWPVFMEEANEADQGGP